MDAYIPIVFPDYQVTVTSSGRQIDLIPGAQFDNIRISGFRQRLSNLGHAGVLLVHGRSGLTKYFDYGRYDSAERGITRSIVVSNVRVGSQRIDLASLKEPLRDISRQVGGHTRIEGVYIEVRQSFERMLHVAQSRRRQNRNPQRRSYNLIFENCMHFVKEVGEAAGIATPWLIDPRPNSYIDEFRDDYPDLDYSYNQHKLSIEGRGRF